MSALTAIAWFLAVPVGFLLLGLCFEESRRALLRAVKYDARRVRGRIRHPRTRQRPPTIGEDERPWEGWAP